jgi:hypothetical protein
MRLRASTTGLPLAASFGDHLPCGAKPADLPVQTPAKFELIIKAATDLG